MSFNQWKLLNQLRDTIAKLSNDKSLSNTFSKDLLQLIQKLPPSLYNSEIIKYFESLQKSSAKCSSKQEENKTEPTSYNLSSVLKGFKNKAGKINDGSSQQKAPNWKSAVIPKSYVTSQTDHVLLAIESAETEHAMYKRIEALIEHIKKHPEARIKAVKLGAVSLLLKKRQKTSNEAVHCSIREGLALLGYADPVPKKGIRILAIDGGGIRGLLVLEMLKKLEELTGKRVHEMFDFFCGVSTGAILSLSIGIHHRTLDEISYGYEDISREVFKQSTLWGTGNLVWSHSYYDTSLWEKKLREHLGDAPLISTSRNPLCPKLCMISAVVNQTRVSAYVFRNYSLPWRFQSTYLGSNEHEVWQAARASAAAPTYFEEFKLGNLLHQDGGILVNNPTAIALHEAKLLWPNTPVQCVMSFGTGRTVPSPSDLSKPPDSSSNTSWANKFYKILDSATDTEAVHTMLNDLLPEKVYYRFNPYLTEMISMVETDPKKLAQLKRDAVMYLRRNEDKFQEAAKVLMEEKPYSQKVKDYMNLQREIYRF